MAAVTLQDSRIRTCFLKHPLTSDLATQRALGPHTNMVLEGCCVWRRWQGDERWFCELRLVRSQSLSALERSQLEGGNQQGEEAAYPEGPYRSIRQDSA